MVRKHRQEMVNGIIDPKLLEELAEYKLERSIYLQYKELKSSIGKPVDEGLNPQRLKSSLESATGLIKRQGSKRYG